MTAASASVTRQKADPYAAPRDYGPVRFLHRLNPLSKIAAPLPAMGLLLFARDIATALALKQKSDVLPFVDAAAYYAVAHAHAGEIAAGRKELERFHAEYLSKIMFGAPFEPGAPLRWLLEVGPYRRPEDVAFVR